MAEKGFKNGCLVFSTTNTETAEAGHLCLHADSKTEMFITNEDSNSYLVYMSLGWQTFTPTVTLVGGAGNTVPVYSTNTGRYLRIGNLCYVDVLLSGDGGAEGAGTGVINIALPVTSGASIVNADSVIPVGNIMNGATTYSLGCSIIQSATTMKLYYFKKVEEAAVLTGVDQNNTSRELRIHFWYEID